MRKGEILINGKPYPARLTNGALIRFKRQAGFDYALHPEKMDTEYLTMLIYQSVAASCRVDGVAFDLDLDEFADRLSPDAAGAWALAQQGAPDEAEEDEKKSR